MYEYNTALWTKMAQFLDPSRESSSVAWRHDFIHILSIFMSVFPAIIGAPYRTYWWKLKRNTLNNFIANAAANTEHARQKQLKLIESFYTYLLFSHTAQFCGTRKMLVYHTILFLLCSWGRFLQPHFSRPVGIQRPPCVQILLGNCCYIRASCFVYICEP